MNINLKLNLQKKLILTANLHIRCRLNLKRDLNFLVSAKKEKKFFSKTPKINFKI